MEWETCRFHQWKSGVSKTPMLFKVFRVMQFVIWTEHLYFNIIFTRNRDRGTYKGIWSESSGDVMKKSENWWDDIGILMDQYGSTNPFEPRIRVASVRVMAARELERWTRHGMGHVPRYCGIGIKYLPCMEYWDYFEGCSAAVRWLVREVIEAIKNTLIQNSGRIWLLVANPRYVCCVMVSPVAEGSRRRS
jgi:hypothetical protein